MRAHGRARLIAFTALATCALTFPSVAAPLLQSSQSGVPSVSELLLDQLLGAATARASEYFNLFKDLTAEETKVVEQIQESGEVSRRRRIQSDFIVYTSQLDNGSVSEYRDVRQVDGAPVEGREKRVQALFDAKSRSSSVRDELARVNKEGARYDLDYTISGLTLAEGLPIQPWARSLFDFTRSSEELRNGRPVVVVRYRQAVADSRFGFKLSLPSELRGAPPLYSGALWLDAATGQLWREVRDVTVTSPAGPVVVQRTEFEFAPSRFGIPLPARIVFTAFGHFQARDGHASSTPQYRLTFTYDEFRRFTTSSDEGEIAAVAPPGASAGDPLHPDADLGPEFGDEAPPGPDETPASTVAPPSGPGRRLASPIEAPQPIRAYTPLVEALLRSEDLRLPPSIVAPSRPVVNVPPPPRPRAPGEPAFRPPPGG